MPECDFKTLTEECKHVQPAGVFMQNSNDFEQHLYVYNPSLID